MPNLFTLLAQTPSPLPVGKGIAMIVLFGGVGLFSTIAAFVPNNTLRAWAGIIGTDKPLIARLVSCVAAVVGWGAVALTIAELTGMSG